MGDGARAYSEQTGATVLAQGIEDLDDVWAARLAGASFGQGWSLAVPARCPPSFAYRPRSSPWSSPPRSWTGPHPSRSSQNGARRQITRREASGRVQPAGRRPGRHQRPARPAAGDLRAGLGSDARTQHACTSWPTEPPSWPSLGDDIATMDGPNCQDDNGSLGRPHRLGVERHRPRAALRGGGGSQRARRAPMPVPIVATNTPSPTTVT